MNKDFKKSPFYVKLTNRKEVFMEKELTTNYYDYILPEELIAQTPLKDRSSSRLLVLNKDDKTIEDKIFKDITSYLKKGDVLVLNDTKVLPARLIGTKEETGAVIEVFLLKNIEKDYWEVLLKPAKRLKEGTIVDFGEGTLKAKVIEKYNDGLAKVELIYSGILLEILNELGSMPLPPYIHEKLEDKDRYQTVYAKNLGSAAAPTAGLHFTKDLLKELENKGVIITYVTLHVGLGTFRPVTEDNIKEHEMHTEEYYMSKEVAGILNKAKEENRKIIAVGTTSVRTLETVINKYGKFEACHGDTNIFIYPGYTFKAVDALITNFHLPKSTLIMLVSAFAGRDFIMDAYNHAVKEKYRFFSFGDAMFINCNK